MKNYSSFHFLLSMLLFMSATCLSQSALAQAPLNNPALMAANQPPPRRNDCPGPPKIVSRHRDGSTMPITTCQAALEPYFPGDYDFCAGSNAYARDRFETAIQLYELAAAWGDKSAQFNLGLIYFRGDHVQANRPLGLAWLALAAERPQDIDKQGTLAAFYTSASAQERKRADALWTEMKLKYADAIALERAKTRYDRQIRRLRRESIRDPMSNTCIAGFAHGSTSAIVKNLDKVAKTKLDQNKGHVIAGDMKFDKPVTKKSKPQPATKEPSAETP